MAKKKRKTGLAPGTLVFTGNKKVEYPNVTLIQYDREGELLESHALDTAPEADDKRHVTWYDVRGLHKVELIESLGNRYGIHPLVMEDILDTQQRPKFEEYEGAFFFIVQALSFDEAELRIKTEQVSFYAGSGFVLTFQEDEADLFPGVRERIQSSHGRLRKRGADYLAYALLDNIVDHYYVVLDQMEEVMNQLEDEILSDPSRKIKSKIHSLKLQSILLRKSVSPLREAISRFSRSESTLIEENTRLYLRDLYDHTIQVMDTIETSRDVVSGLYDLYLSEISFRMNTVMQVLTIISTIFIPLSFLAGVYGMNFDHMPELHLKYGYYLLWGLMIAIALGLVYWFRRKKWL
ncbi:MAG: magnesium/cobalt transporter CorA [Phaeodactylibacter sp.]|nr:magnesium/cobalt transporter CorA [Phaeodactylibacter sp.]MCB9273216.1 magnesium/cobalt transporter CorA [Lewinellaceae bacterium]